MAGAASWSFPRTTSSRSTATCRRSFGTRTPAARCWSTAPGSCRDPRDPPQFDATAFASLTAADFSANDQLAKMIGEHEFASLVHQGEKESISSPTWRTRDSRRAVRPAHHLGAREAQSKGAVEKLNKVFEEMFNRVGAGPAPRKACSRGGRRN